MAAFCAITFMKASSCNYCRPTRTAPGITLGSDLPDRTIVVLWCHFCWEHRLWSSTGRHRREVERLRLAQSFGGYVKSCLSDRWYAVPCPFGGATHNKFFRDFKLCRIVVAAWCCGVPVATVTCSTVCVQGGGAIGRGGGDDGWPDWQG